MRKQDYDLSVGRRHTARNNSRMKKWNELVKAKMKQSRVTQEQLAEQLGVSQGAVAHWLSGRREPTLETIKNILNYLRLPPMTIGDDGREEANSSGLSDISAWDDNTPIEDDEVSVPFLREVELSAGSGRFVIEESELAHLRFSKQNLRHNGVQFNQARCVTVRGNSMLPVLRDGATVGVDTGKCSIGDIIDGDLYAINHNGQLRVKQLYRMPTGIRLRSFNRDEHPDEDYGFDDIRDEQIQILGHVFWWGMYAR